MFKEKIKELVSKSDDGNNKKKIENLVFFLIILIVVLVAINLIWKDKKEDTKSTDSNKKLATQEQSITEQKDNNLCNQLEDILQKINGVGKVKVLITYSQTSQTVPLYNEDSSQKDTQEQDKTGGTRKVVETDVKKEVIYQETNGTKIPITQSTVSPKVEGAIITAQGATNTSIKADIIQAVEAVTGLASHKIQVFAMSEN
jgi:stage III sporulation protein AG